MTFDRMKYILEVTPSQKASTPCDCEDGLTEWIGEYETAYEDPKGRGRIMRRCPVCLGTGRKPGQRYTIMEREALAIFNDLLPEEGMLYPTITPNELSRLRECVAKLKQGEP